MMKSRGKGRGSAQQEFIEELDYIPPRTEERLLIEQTASLKAAKILCVSTGRAQLAGFLADQNPQSTVICHYLDVRYAELAREYWLDADSAPCIICSSDFPEQEFGAICLPTIQQGNAELTRELLQQAHQRLEQNGVLYASINNSTDKWLHEQMSKLFPKVTRTSRESGTVYSARKRTPLKRVRRFQAEFPVRISERELSFVTRPGVFSHRSIDDGTWALIKSLDPQSGMNILDLGCGSGVVAIAAVLAGGKNVKVTAIDCNARAIDCTQKNAESNLSQDQMKQLRIVQADAVRADIAGKFDLVVVNPPYFTHKKGAEAFFGAARRALRKRGRFLMVTPMSHWFEEHLSQLFRKLDVKPCGKFLIVQGRL